MTTEQDPLAAFRTELIRRREGRGLTHAEAASIAGLSTQRWSNIERGWEVKQGVQIAANPRRSNLIKMAMAVDWPIEDALRTAGLESSPHPEVTPAADPREELTDLIDGMSIPQAWALLHVARLMKNPGASVPTDRSPRVLLEGADDAPMVGVVHREYEVDTPREPEPTTGGLNGGSVRE